MPCIELIHRLEEEHRLSAQGYRLLLSDRLPADAAHLLHSTARKVAQSNFGHGIQLRGLIEVSNVCRNNCLYCGIRAANAQVRRYSLTDSEIMQCVHAAEAAGIRTVVLQGGESGPNGPFNARRVEELVRLIKAQYPGMTITLSLGEFERADYERFRNAGADRYLLRHETITPEHYAMLHPSEMSLEHRIQCLRWLKELGYETGCGVMVGSPGQTVEHLVGDLLFMQQFQPEMVGLGPFLPHAQTPFGTCAPGSLELTLRLVSIVRLMLPNANIPATTALATLAADGRRRGILAGANVVMPNVSPTRVRADYTLYDGKAHSQAEAVEGLRILSDELAEIGYHPIISDPYPL